MSRRGAAISAAFALAIASGVAAMRGGFGAASPGAGFAAWSDGFFAAGVFVGGAGLLSFASSDGLFDAIRFGVGKVARAILSRERRAAYPRTFFDYRSQKRRDAAAGLSAALVGGLCLALGAAFLALSARGG